MTPSKSTLDCIEMSTWCIFCLRNSIQSCGDSDSPENVCGKKLNQFFKLLRRYANGGGDGNQFGDFYEFLSSLSGKNASGGDEYGACQDCLLILQDFCDFYEKVKVLEMKMDWKLDTLKSIMSSADKVVFRSRKFREKLEGNNNGGKGAFQRLKGFRKEFVRTALKKLKSREPRVKLVRYEDHPMSTRFRIRDNKTNCKVQGENKSASLGIVTNKAEDVDVEEDKEHADEMPGATDCESENVLVSGIATVSTLKAVALSSSPSISISSRLESISQLFPAKCQKESNSYQDESINDSDVDVMENVPVHLQDTRTTSEQNELSTILEEVIKQDELVNGVTDQTENNHSDCDIDIEGEEEDPETCSFKDILDEDIKVAVTTTTDEYGKNHIKPYRGKKRARRPAYDDYDIEEPSSSEKLKVPSLKELAFQEITKQFNYICTFKGCMSKTKSFFNFHDLHQHSKHHGRFPCNFCNVEEDSATNLCMHEIKAHSTKREDMHGHEEMHRCPRCNFGTNLLQKLKLHHLKTHLNLDVVNRRTCSICRLPERAIGSGMESARKHYLKFHDLTDVNLDTVKFCNEPNCSAYFRDFPQLNMHLIMVHKTEHHLLKVGEPARTMIQEKQNDQGSSLGHSVNLRKLFACPEECFQSYSSYRKSVKNPAMESKSQAYSSSLRRSKRTCVKKRHRPKKQAYVEKDTDTADDSEEPEEESASDMPKRDPPSLKELAWKRTLCLKFTCSFKKCPAKRKSFSNPQDLHRHSPLHGSFSCNFCKIKKDFAPLLCAHEILKHSKKTKGGEKQKCPRCPFLTPSIRTLKTHHLKSHLNLSPVRRTCGICQLGERPIGSAMKISEEHYLAYHDLSGVDVNTIKRCGQLKCRAYFRTEDQLNQHLVLVHKSQSAIPPYRARMKQLESWNRRTLAFKSKAKLKETKLGPVKSGKWVKALSLSPHARKQLKWRKPCNVEKCMEAFYSKGDLEAHSKLHGNFKCFACNIVMNSVKTLYRHEMSSHLEQRPSTSDEQVNRCPRCEFSVPKDNNRKCWRNKSKLINHYLETHFNLSMDYQTCPVCNMKLFNSCAANNDTRMQTHLRRYHDFSATTYQCEEPNCEAYFNSKMMLQVHQNNHINSANTNTLSKKQFQCQECTKRFTLKDSLTHHVKTIHANFKTARKDCLYRCSSGGCNMRFENQEQLDHHTATSNMMVCPKCGKCYHGENGLNRHLKARCGTIKEKKVWICEICSKISKTHEAHRLHLLTHSGPESWQFPCEICGKKNLTKRKLQDHMRTHSKEKPFTCEFCGVSYAHRHNLRIHISNKHSDIARDSPKKGPQKTLLSKKKGIKLNKPSLETTAETLKLPRQRRTRKRPRISSSSSESDIE